ncbi:Type 1 glutamine amidotransferase-like domain-containing protein [bacterium]|nr:Type 1 glutamine amidotransferase-like domain-containing protein [bacterium]
MKLLLTSAGISNQSIMDALLELLGKPISECRALFVPTAIYGIAEGSSICYGVITGRIGDPFCDMGWASLGVLELTALPSLKEETWQRWVNEADVILVGGGDPLYLAHWMRESGLAAKLHSFGNEKVYVGLSAGSMVAAADFGGKSYGLHNLSGVEQGGIGLVDFAMFPHLDYPGFVNNTSAKAEEWAAQMPVPVYAMDDTTAIQVLDGEVTVISEGNWRKFEK